MRIKTLTLIVGSALSIAGSQPIPAGSASLDQAAPRSGAVSGSGSVSGSGYLTCASSGGSGWLSGSIQLSDVINVYGDDGARGHIPVSGTAFLSGFCGNGWGSANGSGTVSGSGPIYDSKGNRLGTAYVSGSVSVTASNVGSVLVRVSTSVSGSF